MAFTSFHFFLFLPLVLTAYYALPHRYRRGFLLIAGLYFYTCFKPEYTVVLIVSTLIDYFLGIRIAEASQPKRKKLLVFGLIHNVGLLASLKYLAFFSDSIRALLAQVNILVDVKAFEIILPVGISYYTFKKISYLVDVYRGTCAAEKEITGLALYVSFFPSVMAGPIDRAGALLPQFRQPVTFDYQRITDGMKLIAWGLFKKIVIADRLAVFVDKVYADPSQFSGLSLTAATIYFSFQIYCDFSGYTDIARGIAKLFGFDLIENFDRPYFSTSIKEFWKRWHISLSSWLMDYLFLPIAYRVSGKIKQPRIFGIKAETWAYIAGITVTFVLCGLWHGASWTFVLWGLLHGIFLACSFGFRKLRKKTAKKLGFKKHPRIAGLLRTGFTFFLVTVAWVFFRAGSVSDAVYIVTHMFSGWGQTFSSVGFLDGISFGLIKKELAIALLSLGIMLAVHFARRDRSYEQLLGQWNSVARWGFYVGLLVWLFTFGESVAENFIYFRF